MLPMLLASGASALVWWRLCVAQGADPPVEASAALGDAYRFHALEATLRARDLRRVVTTLRQAGVEPLLMKGWAAAQAYPELGLRPYSDIDLFVQPEWHDRAARALADLGPRGTPVDLHAVIPDMPDRTPEVLYARSRELSLDGMPVRVLGPEDHLRFLCLHLLRHGVRRPLWLCDVGAAVEALPPDFDAAVCLEGELRRSEWVTCVLQLAHRLLGARLDGWPAKVRDPAPPHWTGATVLRTWGGPYVPHGLAAVHTRRPGSAGQRTCQRARALAEPPRGDLLVGRPDHRAPAAAMAAPRILRAGSDLGEGGRPAHAQAIVRRAGVSTRGPGAVLAR
ncbi:MAG: nucleotidyltransferase family protein [Chloroflexi bacterium]|nr:nucleotidyltransferase family protein [Chloroflexota bacterium]